MNWPVYYGKNEINPRKTRRTKKIKALGALLIAGISLAFCARLFLNTLLFANDPRSNALESLQKSDLAQLLGRRQISDNSLALEERKIDYSIDQRLQQTIAAALKRGKVSYGAFVALDARTGQVLAMVSHGMKEENLALRATFPAASVFKIVTAAAAIQNGKLQHNSLIPVRGSYHTLYRQNVLKGGGIDPSQSPRFARLISFEDALAKSVNSVFGKIGIFGVGPEGLRKLADRFLFGKQIPFDMLVDQSQAMIPDDTFGIAESASGYTRRNTLSPLHGALIAAAIANDGVLMEPSIVNRVTGKGGKLEYEMKPTPIGTIVDKPTAQELELMMHKTIVSGTSRHAFHNINRSLALTDVFIGGKTGTLNGWSPAGRYDWFVGFGERDNSRLAVAALCIHSSPRRGIKASQIARVALEEYFRSIIANNQVVLPPSHPGQKQAI